MDTDPRCCGSGTCIIDAEGRCWCGQRWDGERMCHDTPPPAATGDVAPPKTPQPPSTVRDT